jgi:DNA-directed RNA polymerase III subunit RPC3
MAAPQISRDAVRFAETLLEEQLGPDCGSVAGVLLRKGAHALAQLTSAAQLPRERVRQALLALNRQNCASASAELQRTRRGSSARSARTVYEAAPWHILTRLRLPKFLSTALQVVGPAPTFLLRLIAERGRCSTDDLIRLSGFHPPSRDAQPKPKPVSSKCAPSGVAKAGANGEESFPASVAATAAVAAVDAAASGPAHAAAEVVKAENNTSHDNTRDADEADESTADNDDDLREDEDGKPLSRKKVEADICILISERFIERAPPANLLRKPWPTESVTATDASKKPSKISQILGETSQLRKDERRAEVQWQNWDRCRLAPPARIKHLMPARSAHEGITSEMESSFNEPGYVPDDEVEWRINVDELNKRLRHIECLQEISETLNCEEQSMCVEHLLGAALETGTESLLQKQTNPVADNALLQKLIENGDASEDTMLEDVHESMSNAIATSCGLVEQNVRDSTGNKEYFINMKRTLDQRREKELEQAVWLRFGQHGKRIFNMLRRDGPEQDKHIASECMVEIQETRERLYKMMQFGLVQMQEVSKASDHTPARTYFLYRVQHSRAMEVYHDAIFKTCSNLLRRLQSEREWNREALELIGDAEVCSSEQLRPNRTRRCITSEIREAVEKHRKRRQLLWDRLLCYDMTLLRFNDI